MTILDSTPVVTAAPTITPAPKRTLGILSLVLGLSSILLGLTFIVPVAAIVVGVFALNREPASRTLAIWGIVTGAVMAAGSLIAGLVGIAFLAPIGALVFSGMLF